VRVGRGMGLGIRWTGGGDGDEEGDGVAGWEGLREVKKDRGTHNIAELLESPTASFPRCSMRKSSQDGR